MNVIIGSDHAGYEYKLMLISYLEEQGHILIDMGSDGENPLDDYPDYAELVAQALLKKQGDRGILICGSAVGVSIAANKFEGIRAGVCHDHYSAHQSVEHDHVNILCMGQRIIGKELAKEIAMAFLNAKESQDPRHLRRIGKVKRIEHEQFKIIET